MSSDFKTVPSGAPYEKKNLCSLSSSRLASCPERLTGICERLMFANFLGGRGLRKSPQCNWSSIGTKQLCTLNRNRERGISTRMFGQLVATSRVSEQHLRIELSTLAVQGSYPFRNTGSLSTSVLPWSATLRESYQALPSATLMRQQKAHWSRLLSRSCITILFSQALRDSRKNWLSLSNRPRCGRPAI